MTCSVGTDVHLQSPGSCKFVHSPDNARLKIGALTLYVWNHESAKELLSAVQELTEWLASPTSVDAAVENGSTTPPETPADATAET